MAITRTPNYNLALVDDATTIPDAFDAENANMTAIDTALDNNADAIAALRESVSRFSVRASGNDPYTFTAKTYTRCLVFGMYSGVISVWFVQFGAAAVYVKKIASEASKLSISVSGVNCTVSCSDSTNFEVNVFRLSD